MHRVACSQSTYFAHMAVEDNSQSPSTSCLSQFGCGSANLHYKMVAVAQLVGWFVQ